jgi:very-short-patch-repair endonuclease
MDAVTASRTAHQPRRLACVTARKDLPRDLIGVPFRTNVARDLGVSRQRLDRADLEAPFRGVRVGPAPDRIELCRALATTFAEGTAFGGTTAAWLWDLPLPGYADPRLHVSSLRPVRAVRRSGVLGSQRTRGAPVMHRGVPVLAPEATLISLGSRLAAEDLTAIADRLISGTLRTAPLTSPERLAAELFIHRGVPHRRRLQLALEAARSPVWSRTETLLRLLIIAAALPEPQTNYEIPLEQGDAVVDLAWPKVRFGLEYEGKWHDATPEQRARDARRREALLDIGWLTMDVRAAELFAAPHALVARLVQRLSSRGMSIGTLDLTRLPRFRP